MRYGAIWPQYAKWWDAMVVKPGRMAEFVALAQYAIKHKDAYEEVEGATGVPWAMIAVIHRREGSGAFDTYLGNGQLLNRRTTIVPKGRGPFKDFSTGAIDALKYDGLTSIIDWRLEKQLFWMTSFNGWGYAPKPSPYVWGGTNIQIRGKYVRDKVYSPYVWDMQPGCAPLLKTIAAIDTTIVFERET